MASTKDPAGEHTTDDDKAAAGAAKLFDIRRIVGGLLLLYGVILRVACLVDGPSASKKAAGIDINIWTGLGMAVFGAFFLFWMQLRPLPVEKPAEPEDHS